MARRGGNTTALTALLTLIRVDKTFFLFYQKVKMRLRFIAKHIMMTNTIIMLKVEAFAEIMSRGMSLKLTEKNIRLMRIGN